MATIRLCQADEIALNSARAFEVDGHKICVVRLEEGFFAIDDTCSHEDYSLAEGMVDASTCEIECWKHGSMFSLQTGEPTTLPATRPVKTYEVQVADDDLSVVL